MVFIKNVPLEFISSFPEVVSREVALGAFGDCPARIHGESKQVLNIRKNNITYVHLSLIKSSPLHVHDQLYISLAPSHN